MHPATAVRAEFDEEIDMGTGVPQSYYIDEFADEGIMLEGAAGPPDYLAMSFPFSRERHRELMLRYRHLSQFGAMVSDRSRGMVRERAGRVEIRYDLVPEDVELFRRAIELLAELYWEAGAKRVFLPVHGHVEQAEPDPRPLREAALRARDLSLMAFHPLGTARADRSPARGVVDEGLRLHGVEGVHVADGSVVPSALGVNPQITIMALATRLAFHLLGKPAPDEEPDPETIARPRVGRVHLAAA
jgi:choline dehydrogenase-like flavoprotein